MKRPLIVGTRTREEGSKVWIPSPDDRVLLTSTGGTIHWETEHQPRTAIGIFWDGQRWGKWPACLADKSNQEVIQVFDMVTGRWNPTGP